MSNNKIKILAMFGLFSLVITILIFAPNIVVNADGDEFVKEIGDYKTWTKINKEPIKVDSSLNLLRSDNGFTIDSLSGAG